MVIVTDTRSLMKGLTEKWQNANAHRKFLPLMVFLIRRQSKFTRVHDLSAWDVPGLYPITREANLTPKKEELMI